MSDRLAYTVDGEPDAPVLILGPSLGTTTEVWAAQVPALSRTHRVVRFDLPGHGASPPPAGPVTVDGLARAVAAIVDELGAGRFRYGGVSIGGMIGLALARLDPRLDRLFLLCTSAYLPPARGWLDRAATVRASGLDPIADVIVGRWFTAAVDTGVPARFRAGFVTADPGGYAACCEAIAAMDERGTRFTGPTLVVSGRDDPATPPEHGEAIARAVPGAGFVVLDNAAHLANVERAAEVTLLMTEFLEG